ncbi:MAG: class I SAM-dependent methyltransferase [Chromatiales bacterium]|nr:class I SAM-dependent methyltransferase [Chromatiales bacterium]
MSESANAVLSLIFARFQPRSVVDIGCGQGVWLKAAAALGATTLKGIDGDWVQCADLTHPSIEFEPADLAHSLPKLDKRYDLCISLEVAEHLPEDQSERFVDLLCSTSDVILFGAAVPHQGGPGHINEQWQSFWIERFRSRGFECFDCIRPAIWNNPAVEWWYRQNCFVFLGPDETTIDRESLRALERPIVDLVHPLNYRSRLHRYRKMIDNPSLRFCAGCSRRWLVTGLKRLFGLP